MEEIIIILGTLIGFVSMETVFLFIILLKTPAFKFLKAGLNHRLIAIHPQENHYIEFVETKQYSSLAYVKKKGYYVIDPKHVYIEGMSKVPCAIVYGNFALNVDMKMAKIAEKLKELGIRSYEELLKVKEGLQAEGKKLVLTILGESVDTGDAIDYFNASERSDLIEAEIQRRTASQIISRLGQPGDIFKWAVILVIVMIGAAIAYAIVSQFIGAPQLPNPMTTLAKVIAPVQTNITGVAVR